MARTTIDEDELTACLAGLPLLEQLIIADVDGDHADATHTLITDTLLRRLTYQMADRPVVVPRLNFLCLTSLLHFSDDVYWEFIASRLVPARWNGIVLEAKVYYLEGRSRDLSAEFISKVLEYEAKGELSFTVRPDPEEELLRKPNL